MAEDENPKHVIYGSAGMAAAGMIPASKTAPKSKATPDQIAEEEAEHEEEEDLDTSQVEEPDSHEPSPPAEDDAPFTESPPVAIPEPSFTGKHAVVIGHTGAGDFGKDLDRIFQRLDGVRLAALADGNADTYEDSASQAAAPRGFSSYTAMFEREKEAELCCIAPSWTDQRHAMVQTALHAGFHAICGSPFTQTLKEADDLLTLSHEKGKKIAITDLLRCDPLIARFHTGRRALIGDLLEMHVYGNMGSHSGGEDLIANALPLLDLVRWFGGDPEFVSAIITKDGYPAIAEDAHESESRNLGRLLGDAIHAQFLLESGVRVQFTSDARMQNITGKAGIRFVGTEATVRLYTDPTIQFSLQVESHPNEVGRSDPWIGWPNRNAPDDETAPTRAVVLDWLSAIDDDREPLCSAENATRALEMAHAIWQSATTLKRAYFPLSNRLHPLAEESL